VTDSEAHGRTGERKDRMTIEDWATASTWRESYRGCFLMTIVHPSLDVDELYRLDQVLMDNFAPGTPAAEAIEAGGGPASIWARLLDVEPAFCQTVIEAIAKPVGAAIAAQFVDSFRD
jgi:hypothetical protein